MNQSYDCVVIGAGMAGLTYATLAAARGQKVMLAEQHYIPGGLFTAFKKNGFLFNVAMEWTTDCGPDGEFTALLRRLGVADEYPFRKVEVFKTIHSPELRRPLHMYCCADALRTELRDLFPDEQTGHIGS